MAAYTGTLPASVGTDPEIETSTNYVFRRFYYGAGTIPVSVGATPEVPTSGNYIFRRFQYGSGSSLYPRLAFPRGTNPAQ